MDTLDTSALKFTSWWYEDSIKSYWWSKYCRKAFKIYGNYHW